MSNKESIKINIDRDCDDYLVGILGRPDVATIKIRTLVELMLPKYRRTVTEVNRVLNILNKEL